MQIFVVDWRSRLAAVNQSQRVDATLVTSSSEGSLYSASSDDDGDGDGDDATVLPAAPSAFRHSFNASGSGGGCDSADGSVYSTLQSAVRRMSASGHDPLLTPPSKRNNQFRHNPEESLNAEESFHFDLYIFSYLLFFARDSEGNGNGCGTSNRKQQPEAIRAAGIARAASKRQTDVRERKRFRHRSHWTQQQRRRRFRRRFLRNSSAGSVDTRPQFAQDALLQRFLLRRAGKSPSEEDHPPFRHNSGPSGRKPSAIFGLEFQLISHLISFMYPNNNLMLIIGCDDDK